jgi:small subunit ribosomal protein SAe
MSQSPEVLDLKEEDVQLLLATNAHLGTQNINPKMDRYAWKRRHDGVHILNIRKIWEKILLAARVIAAIENSADITVVSTRQAGQRAVLKFSKFTGTHPITGRFTPGAFTNQIQEKFLEPRLLIASDPRTDTQAITEASYVNIPVIAFCNTDSPIRLVDIVIPFNTNSNQAIGLGYWLLAREVQRLKGQLVRSQPWDIMIDLFIYRAPEEAEAQRKAQLEAGRPAHVEEPFRQADHAPTTEAGGETWGDAWADAAAPTSTWAETTPSSQWGDSAEAVAAPPAAVPAANESAGWENNTILNSAGWE